MNGNFDPYANPRHSDPYYRRPTHLNRESYGGTGGYSDPIYDGASYGGASYSQPPFQNVTARRKPSTARKTTSTSAKDSTKVSSDDDLSTKLANIMDELKFLRDDNYQLRYELDNIKYAFNLQASQCARGQRDLDDLAQYGRRENVVFSNLSVYDNKPDDVTSQAINLCQEIGVDVEPSDLVAAHPLPGPRGRDKRYIARFHNRSKAQEIFKKRKHCKTIDPEKKKHLAKNPVKGFAISPNLTPKRSKLFAQVKVFQEMCGCDGCWVDYNTGKIMLKLNKGDRGIHI